LLEAPVKKKSNRQDMCECNDGGDISMVWRPDLSMYVS